MASSFNGVEFRITLPLGVGTYQIEQIPKVVTRNASAKLYGSVATSITGRLGLQEIEMKFRPIRLEFRQSNWPKAMVSQAILDAFKTAATVTGGVHTLVLEDATKNVIFDWDVTGTDGWPCDYDEITPTGVFYTVTGRLYDATFYLKEILP